MKPLQILLLFFLIVPFVEIYLLLAVGSIIGVLPTVLLVVLTAGLGVTQLRSQGLSTWLRLQENLRQGVLPAYEMIEGPLLLVGGALLLTPGFLTDLMGFACLVPGIRRRIAQYLLENQLLSPAGTPFGGQPSATDAIEGEFRRKD